MLSAFITTHTYDGFRVGVVAREMEGGGGEEGGCQGYRRKQAEEAQMWLTMIFCYVSVL